MSRAVSSSTAFPLEERAHKDRILLVDDEPQVLIALEDLLSEEFLVTKTSSPGEALEVIRSNPDIAVVLTDQRMPDMTGDRLLAQAESASNAVGIMLTGFADLTAVVRAVNEGRLFAYVTKPWDSADLKLKVHQAAEKFRLSQELAYERQLLHDLMNNMPDGIYFKDKAHRLIRANDAYARSLGHEDAGQMLRKPSQPSLTAPELATEQQVLENGEAIVDRIREQRVGNRSCWVSETVAPVKGADSAVVGLVGISRDVTQRMEMQAQLRRSELECRTQARVLVSILDSMSEGVVVVDRSGRFIVCNDQAERLLGVRLTAEHTVSEWGERCGLQLAADATPLTSDNDPLWGALSLQRRSTAELAIANPSTKGTTVVMTATPLKAISKDDSALISGAVAVLHDVTRERELERQVMHAQKMDAIGRLAGGVAHDFNNLLSIIESYGDLLLAQFAEDDVRREDLAEMLAAADRAAKLTRQLLTFSRSSVVQLRPLRLNDVVDGMKKMLQRTLGEDITLLTNLDPTVDVVAADVGQMEQVVLNLAVNARDAMAQGGVLTIKTGRATAADLQEQAASSEPHQTYALLIVSDNGCGMDEETRSRIFEPFFTTKEVGKGTGIGLSTVYGIVKKSGGAIWLTTEVGKGTTFYLAFPCVQDKIVGRVVRRSSAPESRPGTKTIMLVEDELEVRRVAARILREAGYQVIEAASAPEALELCKTHTVDLLLTDVIMPEMNGIELAEKISERWPELQMLFMSGYAGDRVPGAAFIDQVSYLEKPLTPRKLLNHVNRLLAVPTP